MRKTISTLFFIKKTKLNKIGTAPLFCRITIDGKRAEFSLNKSINPTEWDTAAEKVIGRNNKANVLNDFLESIRTNLYSLQTEIQNKDQELTAIKLKNMHLGISEVDHTLISAISQQNKLADELVQNGHLSSSRYKMYKRCVINFKEFLIKKYKQEDIHLKRIDSRFLTDFEHFLKTEYHLMHNSANTYLKILRKIMRTAFNNQWIERDPFASYRFKKMPTERRYLTEEELQLIINKGFSIERLERVKDVFLFSCYTGISYCDISKLTINDIQIGIDGNKYISGYRGKTKVPFFTQLLNQALTIIAKYTFEQTTTGRLFPSISNQRLNSYLKEIGDLCGIDKTISMHVARHTFATSIALANGVSMESLMRILGHNNIATTQIYGKVLNKQVSEEMSKLNFKLAK